MTTGSSRYDGFRVDADQWPEQAIDQSLGDSLEPSGEVFPSTCCSGSCQEKCTVWSSLVKINSEHLGLACSPEEKGRNKLWARYQGKN